MREVFEFGDRITVLRDGSNVAALRPLESTMDEIVRFMVGRELDTTYRTRFCIYPGEPILEVKQFRGKGGFEGQTSWCGPGKLSDLPVLLAQGERNWRGRSSGQIHDSGRDHCNVETLTEQSLGSRPTGCWSGAGKPKNGRAGTIRSVHDNILSAGLQQLFPAAGTPLPRQNGPAKTSLCG